MTEDREDLFPGIYKVTITDANDCISIIEVEVEMNTYVGDVNLDLVFDSTDLVALFSSGEYEDGVPMNSTWTTGDWNGDGDFGTGDLSFAFQRGGYEQGPRASVAAVPEPTSGLNSPLRSHQREASASNLAISAGSTFSSIAPRARGRIRPSGPSSSTPTIR